MQCGIKNILICTRLEILLVWESSRRSAIDLFCPTFIVISEEAHQCGRGVLVHCQAGVSRSATIVIAYLMKHTLMTMTDAYKYVRGRRPVVSPNLNFMGQLLEFERDLNSGVTPRILTPKLSGLETQVWKIQAEDYCEKKSPDEGNSEKKILVYFKYFRSFESLFKKNSTYLAVGKWMFVLSTFILIPC